MSYYNNYPLDNSGYVNFAPNSEQYYHQNFDLYYSYQNSGPPPPTFPPRGQPKTYDRLVPQNVTPAKRTTDDDLFIETWLEKNGKSSVKPRPKKKESLKCPIQIHVARNALRDCLQVRSTLILLLSIITCVE